MQTLTLQPTSALTINSIKEFDALAEHFYAESSLAEKAQKYVNHFIFAYGLFGHLIGEELGIPSLVQQGLCALAIRKTIAVGAGYIFYQATHHKKDYLRQLALEAHAALAKENFVKKDIRLHKAGVSFAATIVVATEVLNNPLLTKVCTIHARGLNKAMEEEIVMLAKRDVQYQSYSLFINGPAVGDSGGMPTSYQLGASIEAGLQYAEKELQAKKIIVYGHSLGGATASLGLTMHNFDYAKQKGISHLVVCDRTFKDVRSAAAHKVHWLASPIFFLLGFQLDNVATARQLAELEIPQIVIQCTGEPSPHDFYDNLIPNRIGLAHALQAQQFVHKSFILDCKAWHGGPLSEVAQQQLNIRLKNFILDKVNSSVNYQ